MMWSYSRSTDPPAPFVDLELSNPKRRDAVCRVAAKLDTGADISAIPAMVVSELSLTPESRLLVAGYDSHAVLTDTYLIGVELAGIQFGRVEVVVIDDVYMLLGRDILNHYYAQLNGPELTFDLSPTH